MRLQPAGPKMRESYGRWRVGDDWGKEANRGTAGEPLDTAVGEHGGGGRPVMLPENVGDGGGGGGRPVMLPETVGDGGSSGLLCLPPEALGVSSSGGACVPPPETLGVEGGGTRTLAYASGGVCLPPETLGGVSCGGGGERTLVFASGGVCVPPEIFGVRGGGDLTLVYASGGGVFVPLEEAVGWSGGGSRTLVSTTGAGGGGVRRGKVFGEPRENLGACGGGERTLVSDIGVCGGGARRGKVFGGTDGGGESSLVSATGAGGGAIGDGGGGVGLGKVFGGPSENLGVGGGGDRTLISAVGADGGGVGLGNVFGGPRENLGSDGGGERTLVSAVGACGGGVGLGTDGAHAPPLLVAATPAQCRSRPCGRSEATKVRVKGPQCSSASHAARRHARGMGHPVKKAASRSCLQRPSVSSDSQQMPESVCGPPGKMLSNASSIIHGSRGMQHMSSKRGKRARRSSAGQPLPDEMMTEIVLRLPAYSIVRFRAVSRSWAAMLSSPGFQDGYAAMADARRMSMSKFVFFAASPASPRGATAVYSCDVGPVRRITTTTTDLLFNIDRLRPGFLVVSSRPCHGLTLLADTRSFAYWVCNSSTVVFRPLPRRRCHDLSSAGLAFDDRTKEHKVVHLFCHVSRGGESEAMTMVARQWRTLIESERFLTSHMLANMERKKVMVVTNGRRRENFFNFMPVETWIGPAAKARSDVLVNRRILCSKPCHGLNLISTSSDDYLCNPCTGSIRCLGIRGKFREIDPTVSIDDDRRHVTRVGRNVGLGFDRLSQEHVVVEMSRFKGDLQLCMIKTSCVDYWSCAGKPPRPVTDMPPAHVDGTLYWISEPQPTARDRVIVAFDISSREFSVLPCQPCCSERDGGDYPLLVELEGSLSLVVANAEENNLQIWTMQEADGTWHKSYSILLDERYPDFSLKTGVVVVPLDAVADSNGGGRILLDTGRALGYYDLETRSIDTLYSLDQLKLPQCQMAFPMLYGDSLVPIQDDEPPDYVAPTLRDDDGGRRCYYQPQHVEISGGEQPAAASCVFRPCEAAGGGCRGMGCVYAGSCCRRVLCRECSLPCVEHTDGFHTAILPFLPRRSATATEMAEDLLLGLPLEHPCVPGPEYCYYYSEWDEEEEGVGRHRSESPWVLEIHRFHGNGGSNLTRYHHIYGTWKMEVMPEKHVSQYQQHKYGRQLLSMRL
uniref:F-box domain-containing protein n=1 Tax=Oryza nivara TaxID=4536 RepID=A0A0E0H5A0_ORYNI